MSAPDFRSLPDPPVDGPAEGPVWTAPTPEAAEALLDPLHRRLLSALVGAALTQSRLAEAAGVPLDVAKYRLRTLVRLGLARQVGEEARAGRPMRLFTAAAARFYAPFALLGAATVEEMFLAQEEEFRRAYWRGVAAGSDLSRWGWELRPEGGELRAGFVPAPGASTLDLLRGPDAPAIVQGWFRAPLDRGRARAFMERLLALVEEFEAETGGQPYTLGLHFGPAEG